MANFLDKWAPLAGFAYYVAGRAGHADARPCLPVDLHPGRPSRVREDKLKEALARANAKLAELNSMNNRFINMANKLVDNAAKEPF